MHLFSFFYNWTYYSFIYLNYTWTEELKMYKSSTTEKLGFQPLFSISTRHEYLFWLLFCLGEYGFEFDSLYTWKYLLYSSSCKPFLLHDLLLFFNSSVCLLSASPIFTYFVIELRPLWRFYFYFQSWLYFPAQTSFVLLIWSIVCNFAGLTSSPVLDL